MDEQSEVIKQQMEQTRSSLHEKLETLEQHVTSAVTGTTEAVTDTVEAVKDAVQGTVQNVSESVENVKETMADAFDINKQMQARPWVMLGGAALAGYVGCRLLERATTAQHTTPRSFAAATAPEPQGPGLFDRLTESFAPVASHLQTLALGVLVSSVGKMAMEHIPESLREEAEKILAEVTEAVGGKPLPDHLRDNPAVARASAPPPR
jgi:ElaB/YqjD/DUF883 family membrane-anchored ribosome-binding protein